MIRTFRFSNALLAFSALSASMLLAQDKPDPSPETETPGESAGTISEVILYQGTALVTREVTIPSESQGTFEFLVRDLPTATDPESVFADEANGLEIRSVSCRLRETEEINRYQKDVAALDQSIKELERKISTSRNEIALRRIRQDFLRDLGQFVAPTAQLELTRGVLQADQLESITRMHFSEYEQASQDILGLDFSLDDDARELEKLRTRRKRLASGPPVTYDAVLYLEKRSDDPGKFHLNYLVRDCGWQPLLNVHGETAASEVELEFNALIHQVTGEPWSNARLSLSTASPTASAYNPRLTPMYVRVRKKGDQADPTPAVSPYSQPLEEKKLAVKGLLRGGSIEKIADANFRANDSAANVQLIELSERQTSHLRQGPIGSEDEDLSIQYELANPVTLISRREAQMVPVLKHRHTASFYHVAVPILTSSVFREAELTNATDHDLLGGQVNVYLDGEFIGKTDMPTIARGRNYTLGFGVDGQLRARRTLVDRQESVQGGNKLVTIDCEVVLENYKTEAVQIRLRERTPYLEETSLLKVALMDGDDRPDLSDDPDYRRFERPRGILRWDLEVPPGSRDEATPLRYTYSLEFDKNVTLEDITSEQKTRLKNEFLESTRRTTKGSPFKKKG